MPRSRREFGFWRAVGRLRIAQVIGRLEALAALVLGIGGGVLAARFTVTDQRMAAAGDFQALSGALAGIVFAGFALVVGLMSDQYVLWLKKTADGIPGFLGPFLVGVGLQITSLLVAVTYRVAAKALPAPWESVAFALAATIFVYAALDVVALARSVFAHAVTRADLAEIESLENQAAQLRGRRPRREIDGS